MPSNILNNSMARHWTFLLRTETELSLSTSSSNEDIPSP